MKRVEEMVREIERYRQPALNAQKRVGRKQNTDDLLGGSLACLSQSSDVASVKNIPSFPADMAQQQARSILPTCESITDTNKVNSPELWEHRSKIQEAAPGLCITNFFGAKNFRLLKAEKMTHIVICANEFPVAFDRDFQYLKLDGLTDNTHTSIKAHFARALPWINEALQNKGRVLLHCAAGSSRSGAILVGYLMWSQHISLTAALVIARNARPIIAPNPGFLAQLYDFELGDYSLR